MVSSRRERIHLTHIYMGPWRSLATSVYHVFLDMMRKDLKKYVLTNSNRIINAILQLLAKDFGEPPVRMQGILLPV